MKKAGLLVALVAVCCSCNVQVVNPDDKTKTDKSYEEHDWGQGNGVTEPVVLKLTSQQELLLKQSNEFSLNLLQQVYGTEDATENVIISPLSASMALSMLANGADGETLQQVKEGLGFGEWSDEDVNEYNKLMLTSLPRLDTCTMLELANSLWFKVGFPVKDDFVSLNKQYFNAEVENVDFHDPQTAEQINQWAADHTHDLIKEVVDADMIYDCVALLANALYFKGTWADKFEKGKTQDKEFTTSKSATTVVDMMHKEGDMKYRYLADKKAQLLELDYLGGAYCMDILLPGTDTDIPTLLKEIDAEEMQGWEDNLWPEEKIWGYDPETYEEKQMTARLLNKVKVQLPKFTLRYERKMNDDLEALGMKDMFDPFDSDFSRLSDVDTYVSLVKQNTYMSVDESGTEAAAVTVIGFTENSAEPPAIPEMYMNHPFVLFIREKAYGTILFAAVIGNPNEK